MISLEWLARIARWNGC